MFDDRDPRRLDAVRDQRAGAGSKRNRPWVDRLKKRSERAGEALGHSLGRSRTGLASAGARLIRGSADVGRRALASVAASASRAAERATLGWQKQFGEDAGQVLDRCPIAIGIIQQRTAFYQDPECFELLYNLRVRPVVGAMLLTGAGGGLAAYDEVLSRLTRYAFDDNVFAGRVLGAAVERLVGSETSVSVNRFVDTVPGAGYVGGGWIHRVEHGHDLATILDIWDQQGTAGALQAAYHVYGRDFFTPAGIPILPAGSSEACDFLTENLGLGTQHAADLLSINLVELLAGILSVAGMIRLWRITAQLRTDAIVRRLVKRSREAVQRGDYLMARELIIRALIKRPVDPSLNFFKAWTYHRSENTIEAHDAYCDSVRLMAEEDMPAVYGGAAISLRGIAATAALATSAALSRDPAHQPAWLDRVTLLARAGISSFETMADRLIDRRWFRSIGQRSLLPARHVSAALNYYLAGQLAGGAFVLADRDDILLRAATAFEQSIIAAQEHGGLVGREGEVEFIQRFVAAQFRPPRKSG